MEKWRPRSEKRECVMCMETECANHFEHLPSGCLLYHDIDLCGFVRKKPTRASEELKQKYKRFGTRKWREEMLKKVGAWGLVYLRADELNATLSNEGYQRRELISAILEALRRDPPPAAAREKMEEIVKTVGGYAARFAEHIEEKGVQP